MKKTSMIRILAALTLALLMLLPGSALARAAKSRPLEEHISRDDITSLDQIKAPSPDLDFTFMRVMITTGTTSYIDLDLYCKYHFDGGTFVFGDEDGEPYLIRVSVSGGSVTVTERTTGEVMAQGDTVSLIRVDPCYEAGYAKLTSSGSSSTQDRMYLGDFKFSSENGSVRMINVVPMAYYLFGIVGYELNSYCQPEALKSQAIASKVFGMYFVDPSEPYDVQDGYTRAVFQAYRGYKENRLPTMPYCIAVTGEALSWNDMILYTSYGHSNGGETSLPSHHSSSGNTQYDGAYEVTLDDIEFDNYTECTEYVHVTFGGVGDDSRFIDFILKKAKLELGIDPTALLSISEFYTYDPLPGTTRAMQKLHVKARIEYRADGKDGEADPSPAPTQEPAPTLAQLTYTLDCPTSELRSLELSDIDGSGDSYSSCKYAFEENYRMYWGEARENGYDMYFCRYGYGTGLSQMGAEIRANPETYAMNYHDIISFYYPHFDFISITEEPVPSGAEIPVNEEDVAAYAECITATNFKVGPSASFGTIGLVQPGDHVDILGFENSYYYHARWRGEDGYILITSLRITLFPSPIDGIFTLCDGRTTAAANLRSQPIKDDANIITRLAKNTRVTAWMHFDKWYFITTEDGWAGFMSNLNIEFGDPYESSGICPLVPQTPPRLSSVRPHIPPQDPEFGRIDPE